MKKAVYFLFYKVSYFWRSISDDNLYDWKALVVVSVLQIFLLGDIYIWCDIIFKEDNIEFPHPKLILALLALLISIINYNFFLHNDKWKQYEVEFKSYKKKRNIIGGLLVVIFILLVISSIVFSFYMMSKIDWSKYR